MNFDALKEFMDSLTAWIIPGNSICVYYKGKEIFNYASGYADIENKIPMSIDKYINIYSCTKVTTAVSVLQLFERRYFSLDDPVYDFIPEYRNMTVIDNAGNIRKAKNPITIRHLLTMTAGLTYNLKSDSIKEAISETNGNADTLTVIKKLAKDPLIFEPGEDWNYSLCHDVLAGVIEVVSGMKFSEYCRKNVFEPLGICAKFHITDKLKPKMATQYEYKTASTGSDDVKNQISSSNDGGELVVNNVNHHRLGPKYDSGGAGIVTTVRDYAKLADALANGGIGVTGEKLISDKTIEMMKENQLNDKQLKSCNWAQLKGYGYGLGVRTLISKELSGSNGSLGEIGWGGAAGATLLSDSKLGFSYFYSHHMLNPQEDYYQPRLRNAAYESFYKYKEETL